MESSEQKQEQKKLTKESTLSSKKLESREILPKYEKA
jgi:hypothetical protein